MAQNCAVHYLQLLETFEPPRGEIKKFSGQVPTSDQLGCGGFIG